MLSERVSPLGEILVIVLVLGVLVFIVTVSPILNLLILAVLVITKRFEPVSVVHVIGELVLGV
jgi:hypothetical protein